MNREKALELFIEVAKTSPVKFNHSRSDHNPYIVSDGEDVELVCLKGQCISLSSENSNNVHRIADWLMEQDEVSSVLNRH